MGLAETGRFHPLPRSGPMLPLPMVMRRAWDGSMSSMSEEKNALTSE